MRYGCLNSDISKYGHLKEKCLYFHLKIQNSKCDDIVIDILFRHMLDKFYKLWPKNGYVMQDSVQ